tara:strand:- start:754 stop:960 length:207 start_codon:yes stop_codon:yes gene_type:complete
MYMKKWKVITERTSHVVEANSASAALQKISDLDDTPVNQVSIYVDNEQDPWGAIKQAVKDFINHEKLT